MKLIKKSLLTVFAAFVAIFSFSAEPDEEYSSSEPAKTKIDPFDGLKIQITGILTPGEDYSGTFEVVNPSYSPSTFYYKLSVEPFSVNEKYEPVYENNGDYNQIVNWIELESETGSIEPNETVHINFTVHTPATAPAGGQYAVIRVASDYDMMAKENENSLNIQNIMTIAHILYAEVAGETERGGEILDTKVPSFLFSGNISGSAITKNTGNVHSDGTYTLQVFPLFSKEEIYTNEESPLTRTIIPEATRTSVVTWEETPNVGIFHVIFNADFEGAHSTVDKYVIICPLWLLFIIILAIFLIVFKILSGKKKKE